MFSRALGRIVDRLKTINYVMKRVKQILGVARNVENVCNVRYQNFFNKLRSFSETSQMWTDLKCSQSTNVEGPGATRQNSLARGHLSMQTRETSAARRPCVRGA